MRSKKEIEEELKTFSAGVKMIEYDNPPNFAWDKALKWVLKEQ